MKIKEFYNKHKKKIIIGGLLIPTITGTYFGNKEEFCLPLVFNVKEGTSYGINLNLATAFKPGSKFYGISIALVSYQYGGDIYGINLGAVNFSGGTNKKRLNGLEASLYANVGGEEDAKLKEVNGIQASFFANHANKGKLVQVGFMNEIKKRNNKTKTRLLFNHYFKGKSKR